MLIAPDLAGKDFKPNVPLAAEPLELTEESATVRSLCEKFIKFPFKCVTCFESVTMTPRNK
jgi:hypothetical protein